MEDFARGCMRTYLILREKAKRWNSDPEIQSLRRDIASASAPHNVSKYSNAYRDALFLETLDRTGNTYTQVMKSVLASAVSEEGETTFPRKWNYEFVDMAVVDKSKQNTPHFTSEVVTGILGFSKGYKQEAVGR